MKRFIDLTASVTVAIVTAPITLVVCLAIYLEDRGPVFYAQKRVGKHGEEFSILKFRSMRLGAERQGAQFSSENDSRVTKIGKFLRAHRLDEIPQVINVIKGDMSFVGPRPERPEFVREFVDAIPGFNDRHAVRPGMTGLAQVSHQYTSDAAGAAKKFRYDMLYVRKYMWLVDLVIIFKTFRIVAKGL